MRRATRWLLAAASVLALWGCGGGHNDDNTSTASTGNTSPQSFAAKASVVSSRPDVVSGGSTLIKVTYPTGALAKNIAVTLNGTDVTGAFNDDGKGNFTGLVTGLTVGKNSIAVKTAGTVSDTLEVTNYPITGPIFSGPQEKPFICETQDFTLPDGSKLGPALDGNCSIGTVVQYMYRTTAATGPQFKLLSDSRQLPSDVASTTTTDGKTVPYIVRVETGTINRGIYQIAMLNDPSKEPAPSLTSAPAGWNHKLVYTFGGGCTGGWYRQGNSTGGVMDDKILRQGYAMASSSLNVFGNNCQDLTAAETMGMVKEYFVKKMSAPKYTIGWGCSGGSYQQHQIADNYPGLLDGILPGCSFPEVAFATVYEITDARLLYNYFNNTNPGVFASEQQRQVSGFVTVRSLDNPAINGGALRINPTGFCPSVLPVVLRYDPVTNPRGARCDVYDHQVNVYGRDPVTGFALRPLDNVGVQYGLGALVARTITVDQFIDLNARIGGYDQDGNFQPGRSVGSLPAMTAAYQTGRLTNAGGGLKDVPIIDYRAYTDDQPIGDIHQRYHSFSMRERLKKANGTAANQVMLVEDFRFGYYSSDSPMLLDALAQMDKWLAAIQADTATDAMAAKVIRNKPATLQEGCNTRDANPTKIVETQSQSGGQCLALYPAPGAPHQVAGAPMSADIIKCQLKPIDVADYGGVPFTSAQMLRLQQAFPGGVCDWSKTGVAQQGLNGTWLKF
jgi:hypothetical protein